MKLNDIGYGLVCGIMDRHPERDVGQIDYVVECLGAFADWHDYGGVWVRGRVIPCRNLEDARARYHFSRNHPELNTRDLLAATEAM